MPMTKGVAKNIFVDPELWEKFRKKHRGSINNRVNELLRCDIESDEETFRRHKELKRRLYEIFEQL